MTLVLTPSPLHPAPDNNQLYYKNLLFFANILLFVIWTFCIQIIYIKSIKYRRSITDDITECNRVRKRERTQKLLWPKSEVGKNENNANHMLDIINFYWSNLRISSQQFECWTHFFFSRVCVWFAICIIHLDRKVNISVLNGEKKNDILLVGHTKVPCT